MTPSWQKYPEPFPCPTFKANGGGYHITVSGPISTNEEADILCRSFSTHGGHMDATGINHLPDDLYPLSIDKFSVVY